ncbi:STAS domain-containing protein [Amycolatopsis sp. Hca4]|uniref:STAS domain-containing protein n=1 Tax=unclassified Amycolatopsis TaxID=2618356 RepID=UPI00159020F6|nr:STAS domain-containing protein [Amycolatopsis sp. Hca4]QKV80416.1 STAS domain-containing protein [Amycolatopsis sp. Hca4]
MTPLTLETSRRGDGNRVLTATGEIDLSNVADFSRALGDATADGPVIVDLRAVDYLDSGAINALFAHADQISLVINPVLGPVLTISGLTSLVDVGH